MVKITRKEDAMGGRSLYHSGGDAINHCLLQVEATVVAQTKSQANN